MVNTIYHTRRDLLFSGVINISSYTNAMSNLNNEVEIFNNITAFLYIVRAILRLSCVHRVTYTKL